MRTLAVVGVMLGLVVAAGAGEAAVGGSSLQPNCPQVIAGAGQCASADTQGWLVAGEQIAQADSTAQPCPVPTTDQPDQATSAPSDSSATLLDWRTRRGPAYPDDYWRSLGRDVKEMPAVLWDDTKATATNPVSLIALTAAGITGVALSGNRGNDQVQEHFERHGHQLNSEWDSFGSTVGSPATHFAAAGLAYMLTLDGEHDKTNEVSKALISALALNGLTTVVLKGAAHTESPNGDENGWPSGHTSSSFTVATVMAEYYGPWVGVPSYLLASFVGYERLDARNHDFNDVISGAFIGIAFGHAIAQNRMPRVMGMDVIPYATADGGVGVALYGRK